MKSIFMLLVVLIDRDFYLSSASHVFLSHYPESSNAGVHPRKIVITSTQ